MALPFVDLFQRVHTMFFLRVYLLLIVAVSAVGKEPYKGHTSDAAWRTEAAEKIEKHRKAEVSIRVLDTDGNAIPGVKLRLEQQEHAFRFGTAVSVKQYSKQSADGKQYRDKVHELFNCATIENGLKWHRWEESREHDYKQAKTLSVVDSLLAKGVSVRGHVLIWPSQKRLPTDLHRPLEKWSPKRSDYEFVRQSISQHIASMGATTKQRCYAWDVLNEPRKNHEVMDFLPEGNQAMVDWFQLARQAMPEAKLFLNEYGILDRADRHPEKNRELLESQLRYLREHEAPLDGVGLQSHFSKKRSLTAPREIWQVIDRYAAIVDEVQITEFDFETDDETLQADYTRDFLTTAFSHPRVTGITIWGFWESSHWRPKAAMYRSDWSVKPNGKEFLKLIYDDWWTELDLVANENGAVNAKVFLGDYLVVVTHAGRRKEFQVEVARGKNEFEIRLAD